MNNYADDIMLCVSDDGMTDDLWQLAYDDNKTLNALNIKDEEERNLYFYLENFIDELLKEFGYSEIANEKEIIDEAFESLRGKEDIDLVDIRKAVYKSLRGRSKLAYPNIRTHIEKVKPMRNIEKWIETFSKIYTAVKRGKSKEKSFLNLTEGWSPMEKHDFKSWMKYYCLE